jgi:hypothetical protein
VLKGEIKALATKVFEKSCFFFRSERESNPRLQQKTGRANGKKLSGANPTTSGPNPTTSIYNATGSLARFESKNILF